MDAAFTVDRYRLLRRLLTNDRSPPLWLLISAEFASHSRSRLYVMNVSNGERSWVGHRCESIMTIMPNRVSITKHRSAVVKVVDSEEADL